MNSLLFKTPCARYEWIIKMIYTFMFNTDEDEALIRSSLDLLSRHAYKYFPSDPAVAAGTASSQIDQAFDQTLSMNDYRFAAQMSSEIGPPDSPAAASTSAASHVLPLIDLSCCRSKPECYDVSSDDEEALMGYSADVDEYFYAFEYVFNDKDHDARGGR